MADKKQAYPVTIIFLFILTGMFVYLIMAPSGERADALQPEETLGAKTTVVISSDVFTPEIVRIHAGESVAWVNNDISKHRINGVEFKSGILNPGQSYAYRFTERGVYAYSCEFNPGMVGQVIVS